MAKDTRQPVDGSRRSVLRALGILSAGTVLPAAATGPAQAMRARPDQRAARYRETDHIRKYYDTNRR